MTDRAGGKLTKGTLGLIQAGSVLLAIVVVVVFLVSQTQSASIEYGTEPVKSAAGDGGSEASDEPGRGSATLPPDAEITRLMSGSRIVRLPGAVADFDTEAVTAAVERADAVRRKEDPEDFEPTTVVLAPPGLSEADNERLRELLGDYDLLVEGLQVTLRYTVTPSTVAGWESLFAHGDATSPMLTALALVADEPLPADPTDSTVQWRTPTDAELKVVLNGVADDGWHSFPGTTFSGLPSSLEKGFGDSDPLVVVLPRQPYGEPVPDYGAALAERFPDSPVIVMLGYWIDFTGPFDADTVELAAAGYYGPYDQVLTNRVFPQRNALNLYLERWTAMRFAGVFERPLPFVPADPLAVAKPALPWVFSGSVLLFVGASVLTVRRRADEAAGTSGAATEPSGAAAPTAAELWTRVTELSSLAIEASGLADGKAEASLTRGIRRLTSAREGLNDDLPLPLVGSQVRAAEREFGALADAIGRPDYHPSAYGNGSGGRS